MDRSAHDRGRLPTSARLAIAMAFALVASLPALGVSPPMVEANGDCSSGPRSLSSFGDRVYPDQGNGGYVSVHTDLYIHYDTATNLFLPGTRADLTIRTTQCLTDFSFDFERTAMSGSAAGPNMTVDSVAIGGSPTTFDFRQPTYPGNPNGPDDPDPLAHAISNVNPVSATNPFPPACSPQTSGNSQNGMPCPANKLVVTPSIPIPVGTTITVSIAYSGRPGVHLDGDGSTEGWFRIDTTAAPNDGSFVTTEPVGSMAWMPLNNHPTAKPTYDVYDTVPVGKTAISAGHLVGATPGPTFEPVGPTSVNPPDANFPGGSWTWHWHSPEPIANYLVTNSIGSYDLTAMTSPTSGIEYYQALASGLTDARKATIKVNIDQLESMIEFQETFAGPYPFTTAGVIVALPSVGFAEEMQTKITFGNGATSTPSIGTLNHEAFHQWFGDNVAEGGFRLTFWKEGWATVGSYLATARDVATAAGGLGTPAGAAAFDTSLANRFNTNYGTTSGSAWTSAPSNPTVGNLFSTFRTYTRSGTAYLALRQILDASASRPGSDRWIGAMKQIQTQYGGRSITQAQLENVFHEWLPNQSAACHTKLDQFFTQWFDTAYPTPNNATNKPQITGPGINGPDKFYDDAGDCTRADQTITFDPLPDMSSLAPDFDVSATSDSGLPVSFTATGDCTVTGSTVHLVSQGSCSITASQAGDSVFKPATSVTRTFAIHGPMLGNSLGEGGSQSVQYSDALSPDVTISATDTGSAGSALTAVATGLPAGLSLSVVSTSDGASLPGSRTWKVDGNVAGAPGSYPVSVNVTDDAGREGATTFTIVVTTEDADATYTGDTMAYTPTPGATAASVLLGATIRDGAAIPGSGDAAGGDIRTATVAFTEGATTLCGPLAVGLTGASPATGSASCTVSLGIGSHTIDVWVDGNYTGTTQAEVVVTGIPKGSHVNLGGKFDIGASAGTYKADDGSSAKVNVNVHAEDKGPRGSFRLSYQAGDSEYEIEMDSLSVLATARQAGGTSCNKPPSATCYAYSSFRGSAKITDVTKGSKKTTVGTGFTVQVTMTDRGSGKTDSIGVTLWDGSTLLFSSDWDGAQTREGLVTSGNIDTH